MTDKLNEPSIIAHGLYNRVLDKLSWIVNNYLLYTCVAMKPEMPRKLQGLSLWLKPYIVKNF